MPIGFLRLPILIASGLVLLSCQTMSSGGGDVGSGPIAFSSEVKIAFEWYKKIDGYAYFAVSEDGREYGVGGCPSLGSCWSEGRGAALRRCREKNNDVACKIYADGHTVVWRGVEGEGEKFDTTQAVRGSGPLLLSPRAQRNIKEYLEYADPVAFAIAADGIGSYGIYCQNAPRLGSGMKEAAVQGCLSRAQGSPCYIYAVGRKVVWNGPVTKVARP